MPNIENTRMLENFLPKMTSDVKKIKEKEREIKQSLGNQTYDKLLKGATTIAKNSLSNLKAKINDGISEEGNLNAAEKVIKIIYDTMDKMGNFVYEGLTSRELYSETEENFNSVTMTIVVVVIGAAFQTVLSSFFTGSPIIGMSLGAVLIAPITEEWAKNVALTISPKTAYKYVFVFGGIEAVLYVHAFVKHGYDFTHIAFLRLIAWCGHFGMLMAQHGILNETGSKYFSYLIGVILHAIMNFLAVRKNFSYS